MNFNRGTGKHLLGLIASLGLAAGLAQGADLTLKSADKPAPKEISESIRAALQPKAVQLLNGDKPAFEIWLRTELPLKARPASANDSLSAVPETTLAGVISVSGGGFRDYKDNEISKGVYTARFGLQPQDGNHLGTAEYNYFLILLPPDADKEPGGMANLKSMIKTSGTLTSSGHPLIVSLRPAPPGEAGAPKLTEPIAEHKAVRLNVPGKAADGTKADVAFDLVYQGTGHIQ